MIRSWRELRLRVEIIDQELKMNRSLGQGSWKTVDWWEGVFVARSFIESYFLVKVDSEVKCNVFICIYLQL